MEARGIEPLSENPSAVLSTSVYGYLNFPTRTKAVTLPHRVALLCMTDAKANYLFTFTAT